MGCIFVIRYIILQSGTVKLVVGGELRGLWLNDYISQNVDLQLKSQSGVGENKLTITPRVNLERTGMDFRQLTPDISNISAVEKSVNHSMPLNPEGWAEWIYTRSVQYPLLNTLGNVTARKFCYYANHIVTLAVQPATTSPGVDPLATVTLEYYDPEKLQWIEQECNVFFEYVNTRTTGQFYGTLGVTIVVALLARYAYRVLITTTRSVGVFTDPVDPLTTSGTIALADGFIY